ncbi:AsmA family protein [Neisseria sp. 83E34]|uniref:AsmA family protein n=1 Tax=Neisseria sp. 83E34 TaxID=1692264 RepID=UPI0006CE697C|nr:AsmA family protein [Neisseria sp. 83E34]KPN70608.1 hypothetical protein AKG09_11125 [Neisseria sp. 83E34]
MISRLKSGKFWLKLLAFGSMVLSITVAGLYIALHQAVFSPERLHKAGADALAGTGRTLRFDKNINRTWFPRPTVTLNNVTLSGTGNNVQNVHLGQMHIGLAWSSLIGSPTIEKWVIKGADITLEQNNEGKWNLQDLWQNPKKSDLNINRLIIENARLHILTQAKQHNFSDINLKLTRESNQSHSFTTSGKADNAYLNNLRWESSGTAFANPNGWRLPDLRIAFFAEYRNNPVNLAAAGNAQWHNRALSLNKITANLHSPLYQTHISASIPAAEWKNGRFQAAGINSIINARRYETEWNGAFNINNLNFSPTQISAARATLNAGGKTHGKAATFNISSPVSWQASSGWQLPDLKITTRQDQTQADGGPRFISNLSGSLTGSPEGNWQLFLSGLFDRQRTSLKAAYTQETRTIQAEAGLNKLAFAPYMKELQNESRFSYPRFLTGPNRIQINTLLLLDNLQLPNLEVNRIKTRLQADSSKIALTDFSAELYGGTTTGSLHIENKDTLSYHLQQQTKGIQVLPLMRDLLRYNSLAGTGDVAFDFTTKGNNRRELTQNLNGKLNLKLQKGAWIGIDINNILKQAALGQTNSENKSTPFNSFTLNSLIQNGVGSHQNAELITDRLYILSSGSLDLSKLLMNENMLISTTNSETTQIPLNISGPVDNPSVTLNYSGLTRGLNTPQEKQKALADTLREQFNILSKP